MDGLRLGRVGFSPSYTPSRRALERRERRTAGAVTAPARPGKAPARRAGVAGDAQASVLSILPDELAAVDVRLFTGASRERIARSFVGSLASHAVGIAVVALLLSLAPARVYEVVEANRENYGIVWIPEEGPGGGGGGGGNESLELPSQLLVEGTDPVEISLPVEEPPEVDQPEPEPEERILDTQQIALPAMAMAAALETRSGILDGLTASLDLSRGSGVGAGSGTGQGTGIGSGDGAGLGPGQGGGVGGGAYRPGNGVSPPRLLREVKPQYTAEAMRAKIQGTVWLEVVVQPDGTVGDVRITKSLDPVFGLDQQAMDAARQWRFAPGMRFGEPVPVLVGLELYFNLR